MDGRIYSAQSHIGVPGTPLFHVYSVFRGSRRGYNFSRTKPAAGTVDTGDRKRTRWILYICRYNGRYHIQLCRLGAHSTLDQLLLAGCLLFLRAPHRPLVYCVYFHMLQ
uniref:Uncharacterized protein n=1 Tax=Cacopsylla melanoneura TaxID=428564 RepID=A0A8D9BAD4_9HEMI